MALCQLINQGCNSPDAVFRTIRDFLTAANGIDDYTPAGPNPGPGYEIVDESYVSGNPADTTTGDWCVLRSNGEVSLWPLYLRLTFGATMHLADIWLHWDAEAHNGFHRVGYYNNIYHNGAGQVVLYIHADLDEIHIIIRPQASSYYYWHPFGRIKPDHLFYSGVAVRSEAAVVAGTGTVIELGSWPDWARVGRKIYNWDTASLHELTIVAASETARTITVAESYAKFAGSWLAEDFCPFVPYYYNATPGSGFVYVPSRTGNMAQQQCNVVLTTMLAGVDAKYDTERVLSDIWLSRESEVRGRFGLARASMSNLGAQAQFWTDEAGENWRLYTVYGAVIALREAV